MSTICLVVKIQFIKTHPDAKLPTKAHDTDNCWDLYAVEDVVIPASSTYDPSEWMDYDHPNYEDTENGALVNVGNAVVPVGLKLGYIDPEYGLAIKGRSGLGFKHGITPHFGEIDNEFRGDLGVKLYNLTDTDYTIQKGDRIAQLKVEKVYPATVEFIDEAVPSTRGENGFGSSGN